MFISDLANKQNKTTIYQAYLCNNFICSASYTESNTTSYHRSSNAHTSMIQKYTIIMETIHMYTIIYTIRIHIIPFFKKRFLLLF